MLIWKDEIEIKRKGRINPILFFFPAQYTYCQKNQIKYKRHIRDILHGTTSKLKFSNWIRGRRLRFFPIATKFEKIRDSDFKNNFGIMKRGRKTLAIFFLARYPCTSYMPIKLCDS